MSLSSLFKLILPGRYEYGQRAKVQKVRRTGKRAKVKTPVRVPRIRGGKNGNTPRHK